jgi:hypothetical protein
MVSLSASSAFARTPSAVVIEIGDFAANKMPVRCKGIRLQDGAVFISKQLGEQVRGSVASEPNVHIEAGLKQSEEINRIVLLRGKHSCEIFLSGTHLPSPKLMVSGLSRYDFEWQLELGDGVLHLKTKSKSIQVPSGKGSVLETDGNSIRFFNHGRLALWEGLPATVNIIPWAEILDTPMLDPDKVQQLIHDGTDVNQPEQTPMLSTINMKHRCTKLRRI